MAIFSTENITGRQNSLIVRLSKISDKKYRDAENMFRIDGIKLFSEAVKSSMKIKYIFIALSRAEAIKKQLESELIMADGVITFVSDEVLAKLTDEAAPQGIVAFAEKFATVREAIPESKPFNSLYLSEIRDPGNLGTMIRTAYAFGVNRIFIRRDCADIYSPKVIRASMGTVFRQVIEITDNDELLCEKVHGSNCKLYAAALDRDAKKLGSFNLGERVCICVGNEGHGLTEELISKCDNTVFIPMKEGCESLNVASAATVLIWEMCRKSFLK